MSVKNGTSPYGYTTAYLQKRRLLMVAPLMALPFLLFMFYSLGGGKGTPKANSQAAIAGFNPVLPEIKQDRRKEAATKMDYYQKADEDSARRRAYLQQDPYRQTPATAATAMPVSPDDHKADQLLKRLDLLKQHLDNPPSTTKESSLPIFHPAIGRPVGALVPVIVDTPEEDPQLTKLNSMLDKIMHIQQQDMLAKVNPQQPITEQIPDTGVSNSLPAIIANDQVLVEGSTIGLRAEAAAIVNGVMVPRGQLLYGVVSISHDRLMVTINTIRKDRSIYSTGLQVYDMDGLPGIHIPGSLGRETAKQEAERSIGVVSPMAFDPSLGGQVANAGIQTAKNLLSRKVRAVRVEVPAGYHVLLRGVRAGGAVRVMAEKQQATAVAPDETRFEPYMSKTISKEGMELGLEGVFLDSSMMYYSLRLANASPIDYELGLVRWYLRDRHRARRSAIQELELKPVYVSAWVDSAGKGLVRGDSTRRMVVGFSPFVLPEGKELVVEISESNGARGLMLPINQKLLLNAKRLPYEEGQR